MDKCIIITAYIEGKIKNIIDTDNSYIICADGGYAKAVAEDITPSVLIGDFDSYNGTLPENIEIIKFPTHKDDTDTYLAISHAMQKGYSDITVVGGLGGRVDHTIANIQNIVSCLRKGLRIKIADEQNKIFALENDEIVIPEERGKKISVFAHGGTARGVSVSGTEYTLKDFDLHPDFPIGVSNEFIEKEAVIKVENGVLLIVLTSD